AGRLVLDLILGLVDFVVQRLEGVAGGEQQRAEGGGSGGAGGAAGHGTSRARGARRPACLLAR
ncbi:MAG: hypothetical protein ACK559_09430, partial [bacterium]